MKTIVSLVLCAALLGATVQGQPTKPAKPDCAPLYFCGVVLIIGAGVVTVIGAIHKCQLWASNLNWQATNGWDHWGATPPLTVSGDCTNTTLQSCRSLGSAWKDEVEIRMTQIGNTIQGIAYTNGVPAMTNTASMDSGGWATLDFRALESTNREPGRLFRLVQ